jgi:hypothetical protein
MSMHEISPTQPIPNHLAVTVMPRVEETVMFRVAGTVMPRVEETVMFRVAGTVMPRVEETVMLRGCER